MQNFRFNYTHPWLLLLLIPAIALTLLPYLRAPKKYRRTRNRVLSLAFHLTALVLAINLLAGLTFTYEKPNLENELIVLVDASDSGKQNDDLKNDFVQSVINISDGQYRVGVVRFGHTQEYSAELSYDTDAVLENYLTSTGPDAEATDIASALKYAAGLFKNPKTAKIVVVSDGIETDNAAVSVIKAIAADGIKVDTVHYPNPAENEVQLHAVTTPEHRIILGETFTVDVLLKHNLPEGTPVILNVYDNEELLGFANVALTGTEQTVELPIAFAERGMHELRFEVKSNTDTVEENNSYRTYINLEAFDNILLIERREGEAKKLTDLLNESFKVTDISISDDLAAMPRTIEEMAEFEQVVLVNIAYSDMPAGFESLLNEYVYELGGGLFTVGGENDTIGGTLVPHAYNREDLASSIYYKQMLPINAVDYTPPIAVMIVVDTSASMSMGKMEKAKEGAEACLEALNDRDFCGVMSFETRSTEVQPVLPVSQKEFIVDNIRSIGSNSSASGGTIFSDAIKQAGNSLAVINDVERKHIILVTDGNPGDDFDVYREYIEDNIERGITMSVVTIDIGDDSLREKMTNTAELGGGKFHDIPYSQMSTIPEVMRNDIAMEAVAEIKYGEEFKLTIKDITAAVAGIDEALIPPLTGYYGTVAKNDARVPLMGKYVPIYAEWQYGAGNVGSFMCDLSGIWSSQFVDDIVGKAIIGNIINSIFPMQDVRADDINYVLKTDNLGNQLNVHGVPEDCRVEVEVTPISDHLVSILEEGVSVYALESNRRFNFTIKEAGLYEIRVKNYNADGIMTAEMIMYRCFSYSEEYNMFTSRAPIGEELLGIISSEGNGLAVTDPAEVFASFSKTLKKEFDPRMIFLILAIILVLLDIAVRKFKFKWPHELIREYKQRKADEASNND